LNTKVLFGVSPKMAKALYFGEELDFFKKIKKYSAFYLSESLF
jgi:hypothetical protein